MEVDLGNATASFRATNLKTLDFGDIVNDLLHGPTVPARVSFDVQWSGVNNIVTIRDAVNGFAGRFIEDTATLEWSAREAGFEFVSDPANTSVSDVAMIGRERNGVFFPGDGSD